MCGARRAWHCGLTIREISSRGHMKILFVAAEAEAASIFCVNAGKAGVHPSVHTKPSQSAHLAPCVAVVVSGVSLFFPEE